MADQSIKNVTNITTLQNSDKIPVGRSGNNQPLVIEGSQLLKVSSDLAEINTTTKKQNARDNLDVYSKAEVDQDISDEATARSNADNSLDGRLDIIEGADTVSGSIAKAEKDAKDFSIQRSNHTGTQSSSTIIQSSVAINQEAIQPNDTQEVINNKINTQLIQRSAGLGSSITYYLTGQISDVSGYEIASRDVDLTALQSESVVVNNNELIIDEYITSALNKSILNSGQWEANLYIGTSSTNGSSQIVLRVYKRNISNTETLLFTAESSNLISTTPALVTITSYQSSFNIDATDRIVFKVYAKTTRNQDTTITLYHGTSDQFSHIHTPLLLNHNDLLGLNDGEFKHLSSTLYNRLSTITSDVQAQINSKKNASDITDSWQGISQTLFTSQKALYDGLNSINNYYAVYVDPSNGNDSTGNGTRSKPFATIQSAINSFTAGSPKVIYVNGSTTGNITFRSGDQSMMIVLDAKTQHSGTITFVAGNTSIYFLSQSGKATINGTINDASAGSIYFDAIVSGTYNKTGGSGSVSPTGYVEFSPNSCIDNLILNISGNSTIRTLGTGAMGQLTQSNGIVALQHKGSVYCPVISGGANPSLGQPLCLLQGQLQLIKNGSNKSLTCNATYGIIYLAGISTFQNDFTTYGKIDFTGAGANCFCFVWVDCQLATSGDVFPPTGALLPNFADYLSANRTPTNYTVSGGSVKDHLQGIDTKFSNVQTALALKQTLPSFTDNAGKTYKIKDDETGIETALPIETLTTTQRDALTNLTTNLIIYNSTDSTFQKYNGSAWVNVGGGGGGSWGSITGTLSNQTDLQAVLNNKLDRSYTEAQIRNLDPSTYINQQFMAFDTGLIWSSNGSDWFNPNAIKVIKNNFTATTDPTTSNNASQGYEIGSKWINTNSSNEFTLLAFNGLNAVWQNDATTTTFADKTEFDIERATGNYNGQIVIVTNANGINSIDEATGSIINDGLSANILIESTTNYTINARPSTTTSITVVDRIITTATNKASLPAGTYITRINFSDGMPSGIAINDIFTATGTGSYLLKSSYANSPVEISVGSGSSVKMAIKDSGSWQFINSEGYIFGDTLTQGAVVKIDSSGQIKNIIQPVAGANTSFTANATQPNIMPQPNLLQASQFATIGTNTVVEVVTKGSGANELKIGSVDADGVITWGDTYTDTTVTVPARAITSIVSDSYFMVLYLATNSALTYYNLYQFSGTSIVAVKSFAQNFVSSTIARSVAMEYIGNNTVIVAGVPIGASNQSYTMFNVIYISNLNGANSTVQAISDSKPTNSQSHMEFTNTILGSCIKLVYTGVAGSFNLMYYGASGTLCGQRFSVTVTITLGVINITFNASTSAAVLLSTGSPFYVRAIAPTGDSNIFAVLFATNFGTNAGGSTTYHYIAFINFATNSVITSYGSGNYPNPVPTNITMPASTTANFNGGTAPCSIYANMKKVSTNGTTDVFAVTISNGTNANGNLASTKILATFSINRTNGTFSGYANNSNVVSTTITSPYGQSFANETNAMAVLGGGRVVFAYPDQAYATASISSRSYLYAGVNSVDTLNALGIVQNNANSGSYGSIVRFGAISKVPTSLNLTIGSKYYIQANGSISSNPTIYYIGTAISTSLLATENPIITIGGSQTLINPSIIANSIGTIQLTAKDPSTNLDNNRFSIIKNGVIVNQLDEGIRCDFALLKKLITNNVSVPTIASGTGAGTGATVSITNDSNGKASDMCGRINITTGTTTPAGSNSIIATITFNIPYTTPPKIILTPANVNASALSGATAVFVPSSSDTNGITTTNFKIVSGSSGLTASTTYRWNYWIID